MSQILLADDNSALRKALANELRLKGFDVIEAGDGYEAVRLAQQYAPDLIVMDLDMPRQNGLKAVAQIRNDPALVSKRVVFFSGLEDDGMRQLALDLGCVDFVDKLEGLDRVIASIEAHAVADNQTKRLA
jgi:CheY-like chemotaxis protein